MAGKFLLALCALACLSQVTPLSLTKEINLAQKTEIQSADLALNEAVNALRDSNVVNEVLDIVLRSPEQALISVADLLERNSKPEVSEVLDAFNAGLGSRLLVINGDYVQLDAYSFEGILSENARSLATTLYPKDYFQQLILNALLQKEITDVSQRVRPTIEEARIPVQSFTALLSSQEEAGFSRNAAVIRPRDLVSDIVATVQITICDVFVSNIYNQVNTTVTNVLTFLNGITLSSDNNPIQSIISAAIDLVESAISTLNNLLSGLSSGICTAVFSPNNTAAARKRRDLTLAEVDLGRANADNELVETIERGIAPRDLLGDVFGLIWSLISSILNSVLTSLAQSQIAAISQQVSTLVSEALGGLIYGIINTIFPV